MKKLNFFFAVFFSDTMCTFEKNILQLLQDEKKRLQVVYLDKDAPYMKSLEYGIQQAQKKLDDCYYKQCIEQILQTNYFSSKKREYIDCKKYGRLSIGGS